MNENNIYKCLVSFLSFKNNLYDIPCYYEFKYFKNETKLEIFFEPEFMTSAQAEQIQGKNDMHDASAATIILQSYLDKNLHML